MYKSIDLFAGIGGIRKGFDRAFGEEINTVFVSEWDEFAQKTYRMNYKDDFDIAGDITKIDEKEIPDFDICLAGFPCQAFSLAGKRMGFDDDYKGMCRGTLFQDVVRICEFHKPKVIFCENVKGLTIHDGGRTFKVIKKAFEQIGYTVYDKVLNSKDFGVPQNRERIYIVAFRNNIDSREFHFPEPTNSNTCIRDIMEEHEVSVKYYLSTVYIETLKRHKARHEAKGNGFGYEIRDLDGKAGAIVCGGMGRERNLIIDKRLTNFTPITHIKGEVNREGIRKMTPREWARFTLWLVANHGVVSSSMRDPFSAGGKIDFEVNGHKYDHIPQKYGQLAANKDRVEKFVQTTEGETLSATWQVEHDGFGDRMKNWICLVAKSAKTEKFDVEQFLNDLFN